MTSPRLYDKCAVHMNFIINCDIRTTVFNASLQRRSLAKRKACFSRCLRSLELELLVVKKADPRTILAQLTPILTSHNPQILTSLTNHTKLPNKVPPSHSRRHVTQTYAMRASSGTRNPLNPPNTHHRNPKPFPSPKIKQIQSSHRSSPNQTPLSTDFSDRGCCKIKCGAAGHPQRDASLPLRIRTTMSVTTEPRTRPMGVLI